MSTPKPEPVMVSAKAAHRCLCGHTKALHGTIDGDTRCAMPDCDCLAFETPMVSSVAANIIFRERERFKAALEHIVKHHEIIGGSIAPMSFTYRIAREALRGEKS